ncbi:MAG: hypothetical protein ACPGVT_14155 [Maricaulaceae bacterium]
MLKRAQKYLTAFILTAAASFNLPGAALVCQPSLCSDTTQSSTRVSTESDVRVYRGTVYPQDYNSQIQHNAKRDRAAAAQALWAKRAAEKKAETAEAKRVKAEQALAASKTQKRSVRRRYRTYSSPYYGPRRRAYASKPYARKPRQSRSHP